MQGNHPDLVGELVLSAYECAISILQSAGATRCNSVQDFNAHQLDLFVFKDMGLGGVLSKFTSRTSGSLLQFLKKQNCKVSES